MKIVTDDLYCGAYLLSKGGVLSEIKVTYSGQRSSCLFVFSGSQLHKLQKEFSGGSAVVNLKDFKASMIHLKDRMFSALRRDKETHLNAGQSRGY